MTPDTKTNNMWLQWAPVIAMLVGVVIGYVQLSEAVKSNSRALEIQAVALSRITELLVTDMRHDGEIESLRRDLNVVWDEVKGHRNKSTHGNAN